MSSTELHCIIDCSGSMSEYGKPMLLVNLLRHIRQFTEQYNKNMHYFGWQNNIAEVNVFADKDIELPSAEGRSDTAALCRWGEENTSVTLLVLTDGYFDLNAEYRHRLSQLNNLYFVGVGGDADLVQLNTLTSHAYSAEQLAYVLHSIWRPKPAVVGPSNKVKLTHVVVENEQEDEW